MLGLIRFNRESMDSRFLHIRRRRPFCWILFPASAPCHSCCRWRLVVAVFASLSPEASLCCCRRWLLVAVVVGGDGVLALSAAAALRSYLKILVYIRLTMHATNMEPKHQVNNGNAVLQGVWMLYIVLPSPQSKLTYPFVPKFQQVIGTNREVLEIVLVLFQGARVAPHHTGE